MKLGISFRSKEKKKVEQQVGSFAVGECFCMDNRIYMRIKGIGQNEYIQAIDMNNCEITYVNPIILVFPVEAALTWSYIYEI